MKLYRKMFVFFLNVFFAKFFKNNAKKNNQKNLAIIYYGLIGDYVLFRNYIKEIRESKKYKNYNITFIGNLAWKGLFEFLDSNSVNDTIWIDHKKLSKNIFYRYYTFYKLSKLYFSEVIVPMESRSILHTDLLALSLNSDSKIAMKTSLRNIGYHEWGKRELAIADKWYDKLYEVDYENNKFEFDINRYCFSVLLDEDLKLQKPFIVLPEKEKAICGSDYVVFAVGGSIKGKRWSPEHFAEVAKYILSNSQYNIVLCGDKNDFDEAVKIQSLLAGVYSDRVLNYCSKTSLVDLMYIINDAKLLLGGESSAVHFAASLFNGDKPVIVLYAGKKFTRFAPYPKSVYKNYHIVTNENIERDIDGNIKQDIFYNVELLPINDIKPETVINLIKSIEF